MGIAVQSIQRSFTDMKKLITNVDEPTKFLTKRATDRYDLCLKSTKKDVLEKFRSLKAGPVSKHWKIVSYIFGLTYQLVQESLKCKSTPNTKYHYKVLAGIFKQLAASCKMHSSHGGE